MAPNGSTNQAASLLQEDRSTRHQSYFEILRSSMLIGGASAAQICLGVIRTKALAVMLGPAGIGLVGLYGTITDLAYGFASMGINSSGVRQIAEAAGSGQSERIAQTAAVLRKSAIVLGLCGAAVLLLFCRNISALAFGGDSHSAEVAVLSIAVFFNLISGSQAALVQGMRRIADLAKMSVFGSLFGAVASVILVYFLREKGVAPSIVALAAMSILISGWYSRKMGLRAPPMSAAQVRREAAALLKLGFAFMSCGLLTMGAAYAIRNIIIRKMSLDAAGLYQAAYTFGGIYIGFLLQAMAADFYPRLTAHSRDNVECNHLVNEQAQISLLLAGPGAIATLTFAPLVMAIFYSAKFGGAVEILRWICLGMTLRVIAWPLGFIVLAKGAQGIFFWTEMAAALVHVGLAWLCIAKFGIAGAGMAFCGLYAWHAALVYFIARRLSGFRWSSENTKLMLLLLPLIGLIFVSHYLLPGWMVVAGGTLACAASGLYSARFLLYSVPVSRVPAPLLRLMGKFRLVPSRSGA